MCEYCNSYQKFCNTYRFKQTYLYLVKMGLSSDRLKTKKMAIMTDLDEDFKEDKVTIHNAISTLRKTMADYKDERKSDWKSFKAKFNDDMDNIQKSLKKLKALHK
jgi:hypothetical protein